METTNDYKPKNNFKILAPSKKEKETIKKAVKIFGCIQLVFGPETKNNKFIEVHVSDPIDLFYLGQIYNYYNEIK
jgi:hypothetical protein